MCRVGRKALPFRTMLTTHDKYRLGIFHQRYYHSNGWVYIQWELEMFLYPCIWSFGLRSKRISERWRLDSLYAGRIGNVPLGFSLGTVTLPFGWRCVHILELHLAVGTKIDRRNCKFEKICSAGNTKEGFRLSACTYLAAEESTLANPDYRAATASAKSLHISF